MCWRLREPFTAVLKEKKKRRGPRPATNRSGAGGLNTAASDKETRTLHAFGRQRHCCRETFFFSKRVLFTFDQKKKKILTLRTEIKHQRVNDLKSSNTSAKMHLFMKTAACLYLQRFILIANWKSCIFTIF